MADKLSIEQFAAEIKKRRPDLASVPNDVLVGKTLGAAPELKEFVNLDTTMPAPEGILSQLFGHLGVQRQDPGIATRTALAPGNPVAAPVPDFSKPSVTSEGAAQSLAGMGKFVTGIPSAVMSAMPTGENAARMGSALVNAVRQAGHPVKAVQDANLGNPESPAWQGLQQAAGANLVATELPNAVSGAAQSSSALIDAIKNRIPSTARAGGNFQQVMGAAQNQPLNLVDADVAAQRALELAGKGKTVGTGSSMPKVMSDYIRQRGLLDPNQNVLMRNPMTYETGRDFASNAGALSASEKMATNPVMGRQVAKFAEAMSTANRGAAESVDLGSTYDAAMAEYRAAKTAEEVAAVAKKWLGRAAIAAGLGAAGKAGFDLFQAGSR